MVLSILTYKSVEQTTIDRNSVDTTLIIQQDNTLIGVHTFPEKTLEGKIKELWGDDWRTAYAVMFAESSGRPNAVNYKDFHRAGNCWGSYGLMQLGCLHIGNYGLTAENIKDPETNLRVAHYLWERDGWRIWGSFTDERYREYLK